MPKKKKSKKYDPQFTSADIGLAIFYLFESAREGYNVDSDVENALKKNIKDLLPVKMPHLEFTEEDINTITQLAYEHLIIGVETGRLMTYRQATDIVQTAALAKAKEQGMEC